MLSASIWAGTSLVLVIVMSRVVSHETMSFAYSVCVAGATGLALLTYRRAVAVAPER